MKSAISAQSKSRIPYRKKSVRHSSLNWNISTVKTLSFKEEALWHFMGELQNGKRQGKGKILFLDGGYYEGEFKDDNYHGIVTYIYFDVQLR